MSKTLSKSHIFNLLAGVIIIGLMIYYFTLGYNWLVLSFNILIFVVSYILERNKVTIFAWLPITLILFSAKIGIKQTKPYKVGIKMTQTSNQIMIW
ncbi:hypothetical protein NST21_04075 [Peribacillus sp. FSL K6-1552]|uniref:hypothetical protein n=1 Tax=Peribacillus sp. FSL K6-1552 TaxID=2954514 RepID=UPI0030F5FD88